MNTEKIVTTWKLDADGLMTKMKEVKTQIIKTGDSFSSSTKKAADGVSILEKAIGKVSARTAVYSAVTSAMSRVAGKLMMAIGNLADETVRYGRAIQFYTGNMEAAKKATRGLASELEIMEAKNKMLTLGVDLTDERFVGLLGTAQKLSEVMGISLTSAVESLTASLGRGSILMADNIGIVVNATQAYEAYALKIGSSVEALSSLQKKIAVQEQIADQAVEKTKKMQETSFTFSDVMNKHWTETTDAMTKMFAAANIKIGEWLGSVETSASRIIKLQYKIYAAKKDMEAMLAIDEFMDKSAWQDRIDALEKQLAIEQKIVETKNSLVKEAEEYTKQLKEQRRLSEENMQKALGMGVSLPSELEQKRLDREKAEEAAAERRKVASEKAYMFAKADLERDKEIEESKAWGVKYEAQLEEQKYQAALERMNSWAEKFASDKAKINPVIRSMMFGEPIKLETSTKLGNAGKENLPGQPKDMKIDAIRSIDKLRSSTDPAKDSLLNMDAAISQTMGTMGKFASGAVMDFAGGMWQVADSVASGAVGFKEGMAMMTKSLLLNLAQQATVEAMMATARGVALLFTNPEMSTTQFVAAGMFAGVAAAAGGTGLYISSKYPQGKEKKKEKEAPSPGTTAVEKKRDMVVNVYFGNPGSPVASMIANKTLEQTILNSTRST